MACKIATTSGNLTTAGTWQDIANLRDYESSNQSPPLAWNGAGAITPGAIVIDGIILHVQSAGAAGNPASGTFSVRLYNSTAGAAVAGTQVDIPVVDFDVAGNRPYVNISPRMSIGWVYFKFAAPVTLLGATNYLVQCQCSTFNEVSMFYSGVNYTWAQGLVLNGAAAAAPTTGDQIIVVGSRTGSGNLTPVTVTMDQTSSAVKYGTTSTSLSSVLIGAGGTLAYGYASATNYFFNIQGILMICLGGTMTIGTVLNPIPRDSTATLNLDITGSAGSYYVMCAGTFTAQGLSRTSGKNVVGCLLSANHTAGGLTFTVDRDTGWKSGDVIAIAGTTRTSGRSEQKILNGDAGASTLTITVASSYDHEGDVANGFQAEVILLTRNVVLSTTTSAKGTAFLFSQYSTVDIDWVQNKGFCTNLTSPTNLGGFGVNNPASFGVDYCSFDPFGASSGYAVKQHSSSGNLPFSYPVTFTHNVAYGMVDYMYELNGSSGLIPLYPLTIEDNWCVGSATYGYTGLISDSRRSRAVTLTRCRAGDGYSSNPSLYFAATNNYPYNDSSRHELVIQDCVFHDQNVTLQTIGTTEGGIRIRRCKFWNARSSIGYAIWFRSGITDVLIEDCEFVGNIYGAVNLGLDRGMTDVVFRNCKFGGRSGYASSNFLNCNAGGMGDGQHWNMRFENCLFGDTAGGVYVDHTGSDFTVDSIARNYNFDLWFINSQTTATQFSTNFLNSFMYKSWARYQRENGVLGAHRIYNPRLGTVARDATVYRSSPASEKLTPTVFGTVHRLRSTSKRFDVVLGSQRSPSCWVRIDGTYNGAAPRLIMKANPAVGIDNDVVLATHTLVTNTWVQLTGTMATVSEDEGQVEVYVDCNGSAGNCWVDDWSI